MRRHRAIVGVATALVLVLVAGACGGGGGETAGGGDSGNGKPRATCPYKALEKATSPVEITIWHTYTALGKRTLEALVDRYNKSQNKVVVKVESQGVGFQELHDKMEQAAPDRSLPALVVPDDTKTRWIADSGMFLPAQACFDADPAGKAIYDDFLPIAKASYTLDGQLWPASFSTYTALIYLNREHFRAAGLDPDKPPKTIDEMIDAARKIKAANVPGVKYPWVFGPVSYLLEWWLSGAGQALVNDDNGRGKGHSDRSEFDNPTTRDILQKLKDAKAEGLLDVTPGTDGNADELLAMATRQSSFLVSSSGAASTVAGVIEGTVRAEDIKADFGVDLPSGLKLDLDIGVGPFPGVKQAGRGQVGGGVWYMTNTVPEVQQAAAWDFMKFLNSQESQLTWAIDGSVAPVGQKIADDPKLQEAWASTLGGRWLKVAYDVLGGIPTDFPGPVIGPYDQVRVAIKKCMDRILLNGEPVDQPVKDADAEITAALQSYNQDVGG